MSRPGGRLVSASCTDCHTPRDAQGQPLPGLAFAGGQPVQGSSELHAEPVFAYLQTIAPVRHRVDNDLEPTPCPVCGLEHGGGDKNVRSEK